MLKFILIAVGVVVALTYSFAFMSYPSISAPNSIPVVQSPSPDTSNSGEPQAVIEENNDGNNDNYALDRDDTLAVTLPADENSTISTEIEGAGGIAGISKPTVVNITSGNNSK